MLFYKNLQTIILVVLIILIGKIKQCLSQEETLNNKEYQLLRINNLYEILQNQTALTIKLNLTLDNFFIQNYIVIDIILVSDIEQTSQFVACLNFDKDPLLSEDYIQEGYYTCNQIDNFATQKQKQQHLLVVSIEDPLYLNNKYPFLTLFYRQNSHKKGNTIISNSTSVQYDIFTYNFNQFPCHNNCNGKNGFCNGKDGTCTCKENYIDEDCGIFLQPLNLIDNHDTNNLMVQSYKAYFFKIEMNSLLKKAQQNHINFHFKKFNSKSILDIQVFDNIQELPSNEDKYVKYKMQIDEFTLKNVEDFCKNLPKNLNLTLPEQNNQTQVQENENVTQDCFIILKVRELKKLESTVLQISLQFEQDKIVGQDKGNNKENQEEVEQKEHPPKNSDSQLIIGISIAITISVVIIILGVIKLILSAIQSNNRNNGQDIPKITLQTVSPPQKKSIKQIIQEVNNKMQIEQRKKTIQYKKRLLQYFLMPVQNYDQTASEKEIKDNNNANQKEKEKCDRFEVSIEQYMQKQYENLENLDDSLGITCVNQDKQQIISPNNKNSNDNKTEKQNKQDDLNDCQPNSASTNQKDQDQDIPTTLQISTRRNKQCCSLCLLEFVKGQKLRITICSHQFHSQCLEEWLESNENCPLCRQSFEIMDMIDYISVQLYSKVKDQESKQGIRVSRNYVNSRLQQEQENISQLSNKDFLSIFKEYIPEYYNQMENVDEFQFPVFNKKLSNKNKFLRHLGKKNSQNRIAVQQFDGNQSNEKQQTDDKNSINKEKINEGENKINNNTRQSLIFSKHRASLNCDKLGQYSACLVKSSTKIESKQKKLSNSYGLIPSSSNLKEASQTKEKRSNFSSKFMYMNNVTEDQLKESQDNNHTRVTSIGLESQPNYLIKQSNFQFQNEGFSHSASPINQNDNNFQAFISKQPSFYDIKADTSSPDLTDEDSANNFQSFLKNQHKNIGKKEYRFVDEIEESPQKSTQKQQPLSLKNINFQLKQNSSKNTTSLKQIELNQNTLQLNFYKKPQAYQNFS
ncbi:hypothetical protein ABPG74_009643 [Tetrahymena malaccensis]